MRGNEMTEKEFLEISEELLLNSELGYYPNLYLIARNVLETFVNPKAEFKVGDEVAVYDECGRYLGHILEIEDDRLIVNYIEHDDWAPRWVHKKQCRKLRKKDK